MTRKVNNTQFQKLKDKKITIYKLNDGVDSDGFPSKSWTPIHQGKLWAYYQQIGGNTYFAAAAAQIDEEAIFNINWRNDVEPLQIIEYNNNYYEITRVDTYEGYKNDLRIYVKSAPQGVLSKLIKSLNGDNNIESFVTMSSKPETR